MDLLHLGLAIKQIRIIRNYTQEHIAFECDISQNHFSRIEKGQINISIKLLNKIAKALGVSLEDIVKYSELLSSKMETTKSKKDNDKELIIIPLSSLN